MLKDHVLAIIIHRWQHGERVIAIDTIGVEVCQLGIDTSQAALMQVLFELRAKKLIDVPQRRKRAGRITPVNPSVTWVSSTLFT